MNQNHAARCGIYCGSCEFLQSAGCKGCVEQKGEMFWGTCPLVQCNTDKNLQHCGECSNFACQQLNDFAYDIEHGDEGQRIANLQQRLAIGTDKWLEEKRKEHQGQ